MSDVVIAALIGALASIVVNLLNNLQQSKKRAIEEAIKETNLENRLRGIEGKLDVHNGYADKLGSIAMDIAVIKNDIKTLYKEAKS